MQISKLTIIINPSETVVGLDRFFVVYFLVEEEELFINNLARLINGNAVDDACSKHNN